MWGILQLPSLLFIALPGRFIEDDFAWDRVDLTSFFHDEWEYEPDALGGLV